MFTGCATRPPIGCFFVLSQKGGGGRYFRRIINGEICVQGSSGVRFRNIRSREGVSVFGEERWIAADGGGRLDFLSTTLLLGVFALSAKTLSGFEDSHGQMSF